MLDDLTISARPYTQVLNGVDLRFALAPAPPSETFLAAATAAATWPLHKLAALLVYAKAGGVLRTSTRPTL